MTDRNNDISAISASALRAETQRMKIIAENIANADTTSTTSGGAPYQRQTIVFKSEFDKTLGAYKVKVAGVQPDRAEPVKKYNPSDPAADAQGYVLMPNVNPLVETEDMSEANRVYQANLDEIAAARTMATKTLSLLQ